MTSKRFDLAGIGNAIVDVLAYKDEAFLNEQGLPHGSMALVGAKEVDSLYKLMGAATECSGGSTANTLAGFSMLGGFGAFIGKVGNDQFGEIFRKDLERSNVHFETPSASSGTPTARCLVFVTERPNPFGGPAKVERTMATYLGASGEISEADISEEIIASSRLLYFEGYLWDSESARSAIRRAIEIAEQHEVKISFTLSDPRCVDRHRQAFQDLVSDHVDVLFSNEREIEALFQESDMRKILHRANGACETVVITRSEKGSYILADKAVYTVEAERIQNVYDVTGAGDLYASGFLYGYLNGLGPEKSAKLASLCATEVIKYLGARPMTRLSELLKKL